jgi:hypothetical protein
LLLLTTDTMATKKGGYPSAVETPESFDEVSRCEGVISDEEEGVEPDVDDTDGLSQTSEDSDMTSYADDPKFRVAATLALTSVV